MKNYLPIILLTLGLITSSVSIAQCDMITAFTYTIEDGVISMTNTSSDEPASPIYSWYVNGITSAEENPSFVIEDLDYYYEGIVSIYFVVYSDEEDCSDTIVTSISAEGGVDCPFTVVDYEYEVIGSDIVFTNLSTGITPDADVHWYIWPDYYFDDDATLTLPASEFYEQQIVSLIADYTDVIEGCRFESMGVDSVYVDSTGMGFAVGFTYLIEGEDILFTPTGTDIPDDATYLWTIGELSSTDESPTFNLLDLNEEEEVCLVVTDPATEISDEVCEMIDFQFLSISNEIMTISLYPNPVNNLLNLSLNQAGNGGLIIIYNLAGEIILSENIPANTINFNLNVSHFKAGTYLLTYSDENTGVQFEKSIIKE